MQYICFICENPAYSICVNHVYLKFGAMFLLITVNMIYTNEADFR